MQCPGGGGDLLGGGGGATQSMSVGNNCGTSRPPFLGFHCFQNWQMYHPGVPPLQFLANYPKVLPTAAGC